MGVYSRQTFYKYVARCRSRGDGRVRGTFPPAALVPARGDGSRLKTPWSRWRKQLARRRAGSWGDDDPVASRPRSRRSRHGCRRWPRCIGSWCAAGSSPRTPVKRPKSSWRRFEASAPNEWWQIDSTDWVIAAAPCVVKIFNVIDDHSRVGVRVTGRGRSHRRAGVDHVLCRRRGVGGLPAGVLSDNGAVLFRQAARHRSAVRSRLRDAGIRPMTGRPYHPQTTGKVERSSRPSNAGWADRIADTAWPVTSPSCEPASTPSAATTTRTTPHQGIGRVTPLSRWQASNRRSTSRRAARPPRTDLTPRTHTT